MTAAPPGPPAAPAPGSPSARPATGATARLRPRAATVLGGLSVAAAIAAGLMAIAHAGVRIPVVSALGPQGNRAVWPAAVLFAAGALLYAALARGAYRLRAWVWPVGLVVNALAAIAMLRPFRGTGSAVGLALFVAALVVLLSPGGRRAFR